MAQVAHNPAERPVCYLRLGAVRLINVFGAERLMWGSDWPVLELAGRYGGWLDLAELLVEPAAHDAIFGGNARVFYRISD